MGAVVKRLRDRTELEFECIPLVTATLAHSLHRAGGKAGVGGVAS